MAKRPFGYKVGQYVLESDRIHGVCRVVTVASGSHGTEYQVRQVDEPRRMVWTTDQYLSRVSGVMYGGEDDGEASS